MKPNMILLSAVFLSLSSVVFGVQEKQDLNIELVNTILEKKFKEGTKKFTKPKDLELLVLAYSINIAKKLKNFSQ